MLNCKITSIKIKEIDYIEPQILFEIYSNGYYNSLLTGKENERRAQYSYLGINPYLIVRYNDNKITIEKEDGKDVITSNIWSFLKTMINLTDFADYDYPISIIGWIGYISYDFKDEIENYSNNNVYNYRMPLLEFVLYNDYFVFDNKNKKLYKINLSFSDKSAITKKDRIAIKGFKIKNYEHENTKTEYISKIKKIKNYIYEGDIYEVNFTQQIKADFKGNSYALFKKLFDINASPYSAYLNFDTKIISNSPEMFLKVKNKIVETAPIKGTIARGQNREEDEKNKKNLSNSIKDRAELNMIIDLLRNDLNKVCETNSVIVNSKGHIESYENVYHLVGEITGKLKTDIIDLIKATFPGGSITGCPKIRAIEIINETEKYRRNLYTGTILMMNKNFLISNIVIRSLFVNKGKIYFNSGGAITIDSNPEKEYIEYKTKLGSIAKALNYDSIL